VLVTGGSSGIGAATARALAARGFRVVVAGRDLIALKEVSAATGVPFVRGDLREPGVPEHIVHEAAAVLGGLDVVVSNAGAGWSGSFASMTGDQIDSLLDLNLRAGAHLTRAALRYLPAGTGHLVYTGSIAGLVGVREEAWYSATKAGLGTFAGALRSELRGSGIRVTLVSPGVVDTPYFDRRAVPYTRHHPRPISAQVVADAIVDAIEHRRDEIVLPGWLSWPARLKVNFPSLYRLLESRLA
jgi:short-subunit dehydrogenase